MTEPDGVRIIFSAFNKFGLKADKQKIWILYGSQTGNAQAISEQLLAFGKSFGFDVNMASLDEYEESDIFKQATDPTLKTNLIVVCSTYGRGDFPKNAIKFKRFIRKQDHVDGRLCHIDYVVLALGDTNYDLFCEAGKLIDRKLKDLGATQKSPITLVDAAQDMTETVEPFMKNVWGYFKDKVGDKDQDNPNFKLFLRDFFKV